MIKYIIKWKKCKNDKLKTATYDDVARAGAKFKSELWDNNYVVAMCDSGNALAVFDRLKLKGKEYYEGFYGLTQKGNLYIFDNKDTAQYFYYDTSLLDD